MKIHSAEIRNFRSIRKQEIDFSPNVNVLIGKNNVGKTNISKALGLFFETPDTIGVGRSSEEDKVTQDDWFLLNTDEPIELKFQLMVDEKDVKNVLDMCLNAHKTANKVSTKEVKDVARHFKKAAEALESSEIPPPIIGISKEFRFVPDSEVVCRTLEISLDGNEVYNPRIGEMKSRFYFRTPAGGRRSYKNVENPLEVFKSSLMTMVRKEYQFTSPTKEKLSKQRRDRSGKDIANRLYNLFTQRRASGQYRDLKSEIEGLPFTDGEFRPSLHETQEERFAELMIDITDNLSLPIENFGEGLQSALNVLDNIIFFKGGIVAIEEPENSLHPSGQRSLFELLKELSKKYRKQIIISSHSAVFIDRSKDAKLFRVSCLKRKTVVDSIDELTDIVKVLDDLGFKPSYALLSNGVIWVEGPSDRPYVKRWLEIKGVDIEDHGITILPYGGTNLEHFSVDDFTMLNRNFVVIMDSERRSNKGLPKGYMRKLKLKKEIEETGNCAWITQKRALDNYVPSGVIKERYGFKSFKVDPYETLSQQVRKAAEREERECSYRKVRDSPDLAQKMTDEDIERSDELKAEIGRIADKVKEWTK